jgi:Ca-activated chloride channel family protein
MVGNLAGIMMSPQTYDKFIKKYGAVNAKTVVEATSADEMGVGYTSPFTSSTGLNFTVTTLYTYDPYDIFSDKAIKGFESFQANVPFVAYTTQQMSTAASGGALDAFVNEYQNYINKIEYKAYTFVPFGMRHDNPMYSVGTLTPDQAQLLKEFTDYCLTDEAQAVATKCGFNYNDTYVSEVPTFSGKELLAAQSLWKEKKDSGQTVVAVFIADVSGSMGGSAIANLKSSLKNASQYINSGNYIGLVSYSSNVTINLPIGKFDINQRAYFEGAVNSLTEGGNTATFDAVLVGLDMLLKAKANIPNAKPLLFVLSDGAQNWGQSLSDIKSILEAYQIPINTIGYNDDNKALQELANINEGAIVNADTENVVYELKNLFNSQM